MSAVVCGKRSHFDELHGSPPIAKRHRCGGNSPVRFPSAAPGFSRSSSPGFSGPSSPPAQDILLQLRALFPEMDGELVEKVLESCGNNLDSAIRSLNDLRLSHEKPATVGSASQTMQATVSTEQPNPAAVQAMDWVELFVREMLSATDLQDARVRATRALESFEKTVTAQSGGILEALQKENESIKVQLQVLLRENHILKRGVAIQHERHTAETEERTKEVKQLQQIVAQYQEQLKKLELNNYALTMHLRRAQESSSIPGRFHPDVF